MEKLTIEGDSPQQLGETNTPTFAGLNVTNGLTVGGDITAESFIVSSSVTHMTQSFSSGSTVFGDTLDDTHEFTGSLIFTGSMVIPVVDIFPVKSAPEMLANLCQLPP